MYFVTDQKLVVYCKEWDEPETIIGFHEIIRLEIEYNDSFFEDSFIYLVTQNGLEIEFPISSEKKRDRAFFEYLLQKSEINQNIDESDDELGNGILEISGGTMQ